MITKTKNAHRPKTAKQLANERAPRPGLPKNAAAARAAAAPPTNGIETITDADRSEAFEAVWTRFPSLAMDCMRAESEDSAALMLAGQLKWFHHNKPAEIKIATAADGLLVARENRTGVITWQELAGDARNGDPDEEEEDPEEEDDVDEDSELDDDDTGYDEDDPLEDRAKGKKANGTKRPSPTSTTTPAGIAEHDPLAVGFGAIDLALVEKAKPTRYSADAYESTPTQVQIHQIVISPHNPRKYFDDVGMAELVESIRQHGILQDPLVRSLGGGQFELVTGERRLRAAKIAGVKSLTVKSAVLTDAQAAEIRLAENMERRDLSPIEEAAGMADLQKRFGYTQAQLAEKLGRSQPDISYALALLKLPKVWQEKLIARVITPTHARALMPYVDKPELLGRVFTEVMGKKGNQDPGSANHFAGSVDSALRYNCTEELFGTVYDPKRGRHVPVFTPTEAQTKKLGVIQIDGEPFATNTKLWKQLQEEHGAKLAKAEPKSKAKTGSKAQKASPAKASSKKVDPKQQQAQDEHLAGMVEEWRANWLRYLLAKRLATGSSNRDVRLAKQLVLCMFTVDDPVMPDARGLSRILGQRPGIAYNDFHKHVLASADLDGALVRLAREALWLPNNEPGELTDDQLVELLARDQKIDLVHAWQTEMAGPLTEAFLNLHNARQLAELAKSAGDLTAWGVHVDEKEKAAAVKRLLKGHHLKTKLPAVIKPLVSSKSKATPKKKARR